MAARKKSGTRAAKPARDPIDAEEARAAGLQKLERLRRLQSFRTRLPKLEGAHPAIHDRVLRSRMQINRLMSELQRDEVRAEIWYPGVELVEALWWEIRALPFIMKYPKGKQPKRTTEAALLALLREKPDATPADANAYLQRTTEKKIKRSSIRTALSKARKLLTKR